MKKSSTICFWLTAFCLFGFGILYLLSPVVFYHEEIINMTAEELAANYPALNKVIMALTNLIGVSALTIGLFTIYIGTRAWRNKFAWWVSLLILFTFPIPVIYIAAQIGSPVVLVVIPGILYASGLVLAVTVNRDWSQTGSN